MNEHLRSVEDGTGKTGDSPVWFATAAQITTTGERTTGSDFGEIWWPFAIHFDVATEPLWNVTHLPSGYGLGNTLPLRRARAAVKALRKLDLDWEFTEPTGEKWKAVNVGARPTLERFGFIRAKSSTGLERTHRPSRGRSNRTSVGKA